MADEIISDLAAAHEAEKDIVGVVLRIHDDRRIAGRRVRTERDV
jgi:hypothetical protein